MSAESIKHLGRQYRLKVEESDINEVKDKRGYIYLFAKYSSKIKKKEQLLEKWFRKKADINFNKAF